MMMIHKVYLFLKSGPGFRSCYNEKHEERGQCTMRGAIKKGVSHLHVMVVFVCAVISL
jgi:hypothetical protein